VALGAIGFFAHCKGLLAVMAGAAKLLLFVVRLGDLRLFLFREQVRIFMAVIAFQFLPPDMCFVDEGNRSVFPAFIFDILLSEGCAEGDKAYQTDADNQNPPKFTHHVLNPPFLNDLLKPFSLGPIHCRRFGLLFQNNFIFKGKIYLILSDHEQWDFRIRKRASRRAGDPA
jgi:hypothetical protein